MDNRIQKMADVLINYSLAVQPGEKVLIRATSPAAEPLVQALYQVGLRAGAKVFTYIHLRDESVLTLESTTNIEQIAEPNPMLMLMYEECDALIRIDTEENPIALSDYPEDTKAARLKALYAPINIQMRREGNGSLRRCTTLYPTRGYAQQAGMSLHQYEEFVFQACKLHLDDPVAAWQTVKTFQDQLVEYLKGKKHIHVKGENIDLQMSIEGRKFINASGRSNFPDGEIFTGPVEDSVNGWVKFTYPAIYQGTRVIGAALEFKEGKVVKATAKEGESFLNAVLDTDDGSRTLGEFAIGTNQEIQKFTGSILFDEKIGGTVHMAVGQGYEKSGSKNKSGVHWDMICDMRDGGEIHVDGKLFYKNGEFLV